MSEEIHKTFDLRDIHALRWKREVDMDVYQQDGATSGDSKGWPGWAMATPDFSLAPRLLPQFFFLISRLSFLVNIQGVSQLLKQSGSF